MPITFREARIDAEALARNAAAAAGASPADVSADGYGLGAMQVARIARDAGFAAVHASGLDDALRLRTSGYRDALFTDVVPPWRETEAREAGIIPLDPGIMPVRDGLYGFDTAAEAVVRLTARVLSVKSIERGDGVSYGYTFRAAHRGRTALIAIGYGDGIHRRAGNRATVQLAGADRPIIGRVAMNAFVVWLGDDGAAIADEAVLFGYPRRGEPRVQDWAAQVQDHPAVVTATLGPRVIRSTR